MPKPRSDRAMRIAELCNLHNYFIRLPTPYSETSKQIMQELEEHILSIVQKERNTSSTQPESKPESNPPSQMIAY